MITHDIATEFEVHKFVVEASTAGLRPGEWPTNIETNLGNGQKLVRSHAERHNGELTAVVYKQALGCITVNILND